jgi:3-hydroxymyristoyl/3-hydroxydecanoyl-(acyl carrier protein) dehydratase
MTCDETIVVPADHPALAGHFPGNPLVPGALLLDRVAALIAEREGLQIGGIRNAKFLHPLLAGESCSLEISRRPDGTLKATCRVKDARVMTAILEIVPFESSMP